MRLISQWLFPHEKSLEVPKIIWLFKESTNCNNHQIYTTHQRNAYYAEFIVPINLATVVDISNAAERCCYQKTKNQCWFV